MFCWFWREGCFDGSVVKIFDLFFVNKFKQFPLDLSRWHKLPYGERGDWFTNNETCVMSAASNWSVLQWKCTPLVDVSRENRGSRNGGGLETSRPLEKQPVYSNERTDSCIFIGQIFAGASYNDHPVIAENLNNHRTRVDTAFPTRPDFFIVFTKLCLLLLDAKWMKYKNYNIFTLFLFFSIGFV